MNKKVIVPLILGAATLLALYLTGQIGQQEQEAAQVYGNVDIREATLSFRVAGRLAEVNVDEGARIKAGDLLATLDQEPLLNALQAGAERKDEAQKHLTAYLKGWYKGMKDCYWYNRHKGKFATHFGYWSFESGLVSVLCGLDDSAFRDMLYYPKDLVDYARAHPFEPLSEQRKQTLRALPGEPCPKTGDWYALHLGGKVVSVKEGEPMPGPEYGPTGVVIWYLKG